MVMAATVGSDTLLGGAWDAWIRESCWLWGPAGDAYGWPSLGSMSSGMPESGPL
jgi:hypothetical protein